MIRTPKRFKQFRGGSTWLRTWYRAHFFYSGRPRCRVAKLSGHDPEAYLEYILARIGDDKINRLEKLLPWNWVPVAQETKAVA